MSDWTSRTGAHASGGEPGESAAERAAREEQHQVIIELLGAYSDGELPAETMSQIDAHLVGCARCRRDLTVHRALRRRLGVEPPLAATPALRERIATVVAATPVPVGPPQPDEGRARRRRRVLVAVAVVAGVAAVSVGTALDRGASSPATARLASSPEAVPLIRSVLADYRRVTSGDLPGRARDLEVVRAAVPFPVEPLRAPSLSLLAAWTTELEGEPAAVLAYRWEDRIVLEYLVTEARFFQHRDIRQSVTNGRVLVASDGTQGVVAWPGAAVGALLVGDLDPEQLARLVAARPLVRRVDEVAQ